MRMVAGLAVVVLSVAGLLSLSAPLAGAQDIALPGPQLLLLTSADASAEIGNSNDYKLVPAAQALSPGRLAVAISTGAYAPYHTTMTYTATENVTFVADGLLRLRLECDVPSVPTPVGAALTGNLRYGEFSISFSVAALQAQCNADAPQSASVPLALAGMRLRPGEQLEVTLSLQMTNVAPAPGTATVWLTSDDAANPTGLEVTLAARPDETPLSWKDNVDNLVFPYETRLYATDAPFLQVQFNATQPPGTLILRLLDPFSGDELLSETFQNQQQGSRGIAFDQTVPAGNGTRLAVQLQSASSGGGAFEVRLTPRESLPVPPVLLNTTLTPTGGPRPVVPGGGGLLGLGAGNGTGDGKDSPPVALPLVVIALVVVAVAMRRRAGE